MKLSRKKKSFHLDDALQQDILYSSTESLWNYLIYKHTNNENLLVV